MNARQWAKGTALVAAMGAVTLAGLVVAAPHLDTRTSSRWDPPSGQRDALALAVRTLGPTRAPVVLLHGILGSNMYWGAAFDALASNHRLIAPDLLGYGDSPKPPSGYTSEAHAEAVAETLRALGVREPAVIVAHSLGTLVAIRLAERHPELVKAIVAFGPPLYRSPEEAEARVQHADPMASVLVFDSIVARKICVWFHTHGWLSSRIVKLTRPDLPFPVAVDATRHTWASYWQTMENVILSAETERWLARIEQPVHLVLGSEDWVADPAYLKALANRYPHVSVRFVPEAGHDIPLTHPEAALAIVREVALDARAAQAPMK